MISGGSLGILRTEPNEKNLSFDEPDEKPKHVLKRKVWQIKDIKVCGKEIQSPKTRKKI